MVAVLAVRSSPRSRRGEPTSVPVTQPGRSPGGGPGSSPAVRPGSLGAATVVTLQRCAGNAAATRAVQRTPDEQFGPRDPTTEFDEAIRHNRRWMATATGYRLLRKTIGLAGDEPGDTLDRRALDEQTVRLLADFQAGIPDHPRDGKLDEATVTGLYQLLVLRGLADQALQFAMHGFQVPSGARLSSVSLDPEACYDDQGSHSVAEAAVWSTTDRQTGQRVVDRSAIGICPPYLASTTQEQPIGELPAVTTEVDGAEKTLSATPSDARTSIPILIRALLHEGVHTKIDECRHIDTAANELVTYLVEICAPGPVPEHTPKTRAARAEWALSAYAPQVPASPRRDEIVEALITVVVTGGQYCPPISLDPCHAIDQLPAGKPPPAR